VPRNDQETPMPHDLDSASYVSFTTYRKDGSAVSLPVWVVPFEGGYAFTTDPGSAKVRRIRNNPRATLRVCDRAGKVADGAVEHRGTAVLLDGEAALRVKDLVRRKYRIGSVLVGAMSAVARLRGRNPGNGAVKFTLG
jgi:PPOX class probable F420-dependent enzyme